MCVKTTFHQYGDYLELRCPPLMSHELHVPRAPVVWPCGHDRLGFGLLELPEQRGGSAQEKCAASYGM